MVSLLKNETFAHCTPVNFIHYLPQAVVQVGSFLNI